MTATQQFIEDAIAGGWIGYERFTDVRECAIKLIPPNDDMVALILLDPTFWQAVGKTRGWNTSTYKKLIGTTSTSFRTKTITVQRKTGSKQNWRGRMHRFIDHLADGKTIEEALAVIE